ncbi:MAG: SpoIIIAH-like family protein [Coprococcus sp.]|nr:SpoIIIAH-like family protein [Coprococcus sp.]
MKGIFKKNQIIIAALVVMVAVAGYLNYSGMIFGDDKNATEANNELANKELLDISEEDSAQADSDILDAEGELANGEVEGTPGEAVLTSGEASGIVAQAKVSREQVRAKNKETLQAIIDDTNISEEQKADAIAQMVTMTEMAEKEVAIETLLATKGFNEAVVNLTEDSADIVVNSSDLTDAKRAQIEDIVTRKAGVSAANIVITPIHSGQSTEDTGTEG